jgi:kanamycin nucleotidyltransferase
MTHDERWALAERIAARLRQNYGENLLALGLYGSLARGSDGPFSDIEMHCVVAGTGVDTSFEWSAGPWKAEVDVYSPDALLAQAAAVDGDWSVTHGALVDVHPLYDPDGFFPRLRQVALTLPDALFHSRMEEVIVGEIYEIIGKIRNAGAAKAHASLPFYVTRLAYLSACLQGLRHRALYTSVSKIFTEALALPSPPSGMAELCALVTSGELSDPQRILAVAYQYWDGVEAWAARLGLCIETSLDELLKHADIS